MTSLAYQEHKKRAAGRQRDQSLAGREVGVIPPVANPARRAAAAASLRAWCESYYAATFALAWSPDHLTVLRQTEDAVLRGGLFATAMPRGSGKTSIAEAACAWAALNGYHPFAVLIGSDEGAAEGMLESIKVELECNEDLAADYPEVCLPVAALEGIANRCSGQVCGGERTRVEWGAKEIVLPTVTPAGWAELPDHRAFLRPDGRSLASGVVILARGLTGGIRGLKRKTPDGRTVRPTLVIPDDPQTDQSARSPSQCESRERLLAGAVLGLAGPGKKIAGVMPCTVIRPGDLADRVLDRTKHPEWHGTRTKLVYSFPEATELWDEYARLRAESLRAERGGAEATAFYAERRAAMDAGAVVAWPERKNPDELSAVQHAMNLRIDRGERAFSAEYQNDPLPEEEARPDDLAPDQVAARVNRLPRGAVAPGANRLTAFIDVHATVLYYTVVAWEDDFTGAVCDYGTFPDQKDDYFQLRDAKRTLEAAVPSPDLEGRIYGGLDALCGFILARDWPRPDGATLRVDRCLVDANWGTSTEVVKRYCRQSAHAAVLTPSHGKYVGAASTPMGQWPRRAGERSGLNWKLRKLESGGERSLVFDANWWKTFLASRLSVPVGSRTSLTLFGDKPDRHRLLADHLCAEYRVRTEGRGRTCDEWKVRPERPDNHYLDCLTGCCVAASLQGVTLAEGGGHALAKPAKVSFAEMQRRKRA